MQSFNVCLRASKTGALTLYTHELVYRVRGKNSDDAIMAAFRRAYAEGYEHCGKATAYQHVRDRRYIMKLPVDNPAQLPKGLLFAVRYVSRRVHSAYPAPAQGLLVMHLASDPLAVRWWCAQGGFRMPVKELKRQIKRNLGYRLFR